MTLFVKYILPILFSLTCFLFIGIAIKVILKKFFFICPNCGHITAYNFKSFTLSTKRFKYKIISCPKCNFKDYVKETNNKASSF
ncbi:hypothetical protein UT300019_09130 [Clostridium sp. CTA-19]